MQTVALSASHGNNLEAILLLSQADVIYTTQVRHRRELQKLFGRIVKFIPDNKPDMIAFLRERHKGANFITYEDLYELRLGEE